jgi:ribonuclease PH
VLSAVAEGKRDLRLPLSPNGSTHTQVGCLLSGARVAGLEQREDRQTGARTRGISLAERSQMAERQASETILTQTVPTLVFLRRSSC